MQHYRTPIFLACMAAFYDRLVCLDISYMYLQILYLLFKSVQCYIEAPFPDRRGSRSWLNFSLNWLWLGLNFSIAVSIRFIRRLWLSRLCACWRRSWFRLWWGRSRLRLWWRLQKNDKMITSSRGHFRIIR